MKWQLNASPDHIFPHHDAPHVSHWIMFSEEVCERVFWLLWVPFSRIWIVSFHFNIHFFLQFWNHFSIPSSITTLYLSHTPLLLPPTTFWGLCYTPNGRNSWKVEVHDWGFLIPISLPQLGNSRGKGNPWGLWVRVLEGKGRGSRSVTPDPSLYPWLFSVSTRCSPGGWGWGSHWTGKLSNILKTCHG